MQIDVFNGDADGICALIQLRLTQPTESKLVTGTKRDIQLLQRVYTGSADQMTVLDISLEKNRTDLDRILQQGTQVFYVDHHQAGLIPVHSNLTTIINTDSRTCTSLLINEFLQGKYLAWAVTAAFGDNLLESAKQAALALALSDTDMKQLKALGTCINYNSYGDDISDLHFAPDRLYQELALYGSPFEFIDDKAETYEKLLQGYESDMLAAQQIKPEYSSPKVAVYRLPDEPWARRVNGVLGNDLANTYPGRAHAVLSYNKQGGFQVSVRAPKTNKTGADELCSLFPTGGGRKGAAGINHLPDSELSAFIKAFEEKYS